MMETPGFKSLEILPGVHHIMDPLGVHLTLLAGSERALLFDTGYGVTDVKAYIQSITSLPLTVILSHGHHDHALGAMWFDETWMLEADRGVFTEYTGPRERERVIARAEMKPSQAEKYRSAAIPLPKPLSEAPVSLGGLTAVPISVPGHTPGSLAMLVPERELLLLGDSWNPQTWVFFPEALPVETYAQSFKKLMDQIFSTALAPHKAEPLSWEYLHRYAEGLTSKGFASAKPFLIQGQEHIPTLAYAPTPGSLLIFRA